MGAHSTQNLLRKTLIWVDLSSYIGATKEDRKVNKFCTSKIMFEVGPAVKT